jgi:hypothetical protein
MEMISAFIDLRISASAAILQGFQANALQGRGLLPIIRRDHL